MTLITAIALIVVLDVTLIAGLAWAMSRPAKLTRHVAAARDEQPPARRRRMWRGLPGSNIAAARTRTRKTAGTAS